jgi:hypothetical protein
MKSRATTSGRGNITDGKQQIPLPGQETRLVYAYGRVISGDQECIKCSIEEFDTHPDIQAKWSNWGKPASRTSDLPPCTGQGLLQRQIFPRILSYVTILAMCMGWNAIQLAITVLTWGSGRTR